MCLAAACGDGFIQEGETCDDGNLDDTDACTSACIEAACGVVFFQAEVEACDDGNDDDTDACLTTCEAASCGDGFIYADEEECDDGNDVNTDDCIDTCLAATCGDGFVWAENEICDDGNMMGGDSCPAECGCPDAEFLASYQNFDYYTVPVNGTMLDTNIKSACESCGLFVPCTATPGCNYNDSECVQTNFANSCGNPMQSLSQEICNGANPNSCPALNGVFQNMGGNWVNGGGCGSLNGSWCSQGANQSNQNALCVLDN